MKNIFKLYNVYINTQKYKKLEGKYAIYAVGYEQAGNMGSGNYSGTHDTPFKLPIRADLMKLQSNQLIYSVNNNVYAMGGSNSNIGLENPDDYPIYESKLIFKGNDIKKIDGDRSSLLILDETDLWVTGSNTYGGLGTGNKEDVVTFTKVLENVIDVYGEGTNSYAICTDGIYGSGQLASANIDIPWADPDNKWVFTKFSDITDVDTLIGFSYTGFVATKRGEQYAYLFGKNEKNMFTNAAVTTTYQGTRFDTYFSSNNLIYPNIDLASELFAIIEDNTLKYRGYDRFSSSSDTSYSNWRNYKTDCEAVYVHSNSRMCYSKNNGVYVVQRKTGTTTSQTINTIPATTFSDIEKVKRVWYEEFYISAGPVYGPATYCLVDDTPPKKHSIWAVGYEENGSMGSGDYSGAHNDPIKLSISCDDFVYNKTTRSLIYSLDNNVYALGGVSFKNLGLGADYASYPLYESTKIYSGKNIQKLVFGDNQYENFIIDNGELWGTGYNKYGCLGLGDKEERTEWVKIDEGVLDICVASSFLVFYLKEDGIWGMGNDLSKDIGVSETKSLIFSTTNVKCLKSFNDCLVAVCKDDETYAYVWGTNTDNRFSSETTSKRYIASRIQLFNSKPIKFFEHYTTNGDSGICYINENNEAYFRGNWENTLGSSSAYTAWTRKYSNCSCGSVIYNVLTYCTDNEAGYISYNPSISGKPFTQAILNSNILKTDGYYKTVENKKYPIMFIMTEEE